MKIMKKAATTWMVCGLVLLGVGCSGTKHPTPPIETYKADWANYSEITFRDAVLFMLNNDIQRGNDKEVILDEYIKSLFYEEYKARKETKFQEGEFRKNHLASLVNDYDKDKRFLFDINVNLGSYDPAAGGFRLTNINKCYKNKVARHTGDFTSGYAGLEKLILTFNNSDFVLPIAPENATKILSQEKKDKGVRIFCVYRLAECERRGKPGFISRTGDEDKSEFRCATVVEDVYLYEYKKEVFTNTRPIGKFVKIPEKKRNNRFDFADCTFK